MSIYKKLADPSTSTTVQDTDADAFVTEELNKVKEEFPESKLQLELESERHKDDIVSKKL